MTAALKEEYARYVSKTGFSLPYNEWLAKAEKEAEESGLVVW